VSFKDTLYNEILPVVSKPSRYVGAEFNAVHKNPEDVDLRMALVFPDLYDLGLGNLGLHILYAILNDLPWCWAERAYAPAPDMEAALRARSLPLFTHESKSPLGQMDLIGFSLQSELTYTSVLNILDLAGLPLRTADRNGDHPLIFAGGPCAFNPEPLAPFIDFFVIGDGEEAIVEIAEAARAVKGRPRTEQLEAFAQIEGVYVPALHPSVDGPPIKKRLIKNLDKAAYPCRQIVPFTQQVHDRAGIEVMRGCTHGCRFCQAGMVGRPVRARGLETLDAIMEKTLGGTGYEEVSLLSLSTCDYPWIRPLLDQSARRARSANAAVSVPSLRLDTFSVDLADRITGVRRSGLTFAPEAATPRLRAVINKWIDDDELIEVAREAFRRGWQHIKCYFMIGLPTERDEDVEAIVDLCRRTLERCHAINRKAKLFTGISTFVPKPFTPFQWAEQISYDEILRRHAILKKGFARQPGLKFGHHEPESTFVEGLLARGDRRAGDLLEAAFRKGARLDSSSEYLNFTAWRDAIEEVGYDVDAAFAARETETPLPWAHIDVGIPKQWFQLEWNRSLTLNQTDDCRNADCQHCGISDFAPGLCAQVHEAFGKDAPPNPSKILTASQPHSLKASYTDPPPMQRLRFATGRSDETRFLSHLEMMTAWVRALRRVEAPLAYSQGFHTHPKVTFATAPPVGEESEGDYMDVVLIERVVPTELMARLQAALPAGLHVYDVKEVGLNVPSLMSAVIGFDYTLFAATESDAVEKRVNELLAAETIIVERKGRPTGRRKSHAVAHVDIRPAIHKLTAYATDTGETAVDSTRSQIAFGNARTAVDFSTYIANGKLAKPREIIALLALDPRSTRVLKRFTHLTNES